MQDFNTICRICLEKKQSYFLIPITVKVEEGSIMELINYCSSIIINADETQFPKNVCHQCLQQLKVGYEIKRKCLESNEKLNSFLVDIKTEPKVEFVEISQILEYDDSHDVWGGDDYSDNEDSNSTPAIDNEIFQQSQQPVKYIQSGGRKKQGKEFISPVYFPRTYEKHSFICDFCGLVISNKSSLMVHFRKEHKAKRQVICNLCNIEFRYSSHLNSHKKYHVGERKFKCDLCPKQFILNCELLRHKRNHTLQNLKMCNFCGKVFSNNYLKTHAVICEKMAMENPEQLEDVKIAVLDLINEYTCDLCDLKAKGKAFLRTHMKLTHVTKGKGSSSDKVDKVFPCTVPNCDKKFKQRYNLLMHKRTHNKRARFPCDKCSRTFLKETLLHKHRNSKACIGNCSVCPVCEKRFSSKIFMDKHYTYMHTEKEKKDPGPKQDLEFFCEFCGKRITSYAGLQKHLLLNHKELSKYKDYPVFKCRFCVKEYLYRHDLKIHEMYHNNDRPFKCDIPGCTKTFVQKNRVTSKPIFQLLPIINYC